MANSVDEVIVRLSAAFNRIFNDFKGMYLFGIHTDGQMHEDEEIYEEVKANGIYFDKNGKRMK